MILWDVNLLIYAATARSPHHARCRELLSDLLAADEPLALYDGILAAVVRITTNANRALRGAALAQPSRLNVPVLPADRGSVR